MKYLLQYRMVTAQRLEIKWASSKPLDAERVHTETGGDADMFLYYIADEIGAEVNVDDYDYEKVRVYLNPEYDTEYDEDGEDIGSGDVISWQRRFCYVNHDGSFLEFLKELATGEPVSLYDA